MPFPMPLVHMIKEVFQFFVNLIDALWSDKISDLIQDFPSAKVFLNLSDHEMNLSVADFFKYQMNQPESFLKTQYNFVLQVIFLWKVIQDQNEYLINLQLKQERQAYDNELAFLNDAQKAMLLQQLDELAEAELLAENKKLLEEYLHQLNSYFDNVSKLHALHNDLSAIREQLQEARHELNNTAEKDFAHLANIFKENQQGLVTDLTNQLHQIDNQINIQNEKLTRAENDLIVMQARNDPANILLEKTTEINNLKSSINSLKDLRTDVSDLLSSAQNNLKEATQISQGGITSWGIPGGDDNNVVKLAAFKAGVQGLNKETLSKVKQIQTKEDFLRETHSTVLDESFKPAQTYENVSARKAVIEKEIDESDKRLAAKIDTVKVFEKEKQEIEQEIKEHNDKVNSSKANLDKLTPQVQEILKQAGKNEFAEQLQHFIDPTKLQSATPTPAKKEKSWNPSSHSQAIESYLKAQQKSSQNPKKKDDINPPKPQEPPTNGFHHK